MSSRYNWTLEEILRMWPQAKGELRGFQAHLERRAAITASQLEMALQLAEVGFNSLQSQEKKTPEQWCEDLGYVIVDADGWRTDTAPSMREPITREEFQRRCDQSTIFEKRRASS